MIREYEAQLETERALAKAEGRPHAVPCECALLWDVGAPLPTLIQSDYVAHLFFDLRDDDDRVGHVRFDHLIATRFGPPNDEALHGHPLFGSGLAFYSAMRVVDSPWIVQLERLNSVHARHDPADYVAQQHFIFAFHDTMFECVARSFSVSAVDRTMAEAVKDAVDLIFGPPILSGW